MNGQNNSNMATKKLLDDLYKNVKMGADSILDIMPKVGDEKMKSELTSELEKYDSFAKEIKNMLLDMGEEAKDERKQKLLLMQKKIKENKLIKIEFVEKYKNIKNDF